jgi:hypothetical protein
MKDIDQILASEVSEIEKLAQAFHTVLHFYEQTGKEELELLRMLGDQEKYIREQIKLSTLEHAAAVFDHCYLLVTGKKVWDEPVSS